MSDEMNPGPSTENKKAPGVSTESPYEKAVPSDGDEGESTAPHQNEEAPTEAVEERKEDGGANPLTPDLDAAQRFLDYLEPGGIFCFQTIDDNKVRMEKDGDRFAKTFPPNTLEKVKRSLIDRNEKGAGVFVTINALKAGEKHRTSENIERVRAFFVDLDKVPVSRFKRFTLPPSAIVSTSKGKSHGYWLVSDCPVQAHRAIQTRLAELMDGDPKIVDPGRVMRLPGFLHQKVSLPPAGEEPKQAEPYMTTAEYSERVVYTLDQFETALGHSEAFFHMYEGERQRIKEAIDTNVSDIKKAGPGERSNSLYKAVRNLLDLLHNWDEEDSIAIEAEDDFIKAAGEIGLGAVEIRQVFKSAEKGDGQKRKREAKDRREYKALAVEAGNAASIEEAKALANGHEAQEDRTKYWEKFRELMRTCFVAMDGGKAQVWRKVPDKGRMTYEIMPRAEFKAFYENVVRPIPGSKKNISVGDDFLTNPDRASFERVVFNPKNTHNPKTDYNLWTGFPVAPVENPEAWARLREHIFVIVCQRDEALFKYVLRWMAMAVQRPEVPAYTALILKGTEGIGKSILADAFKDLFGQHGYSVSQARHLTGNFNIHLRDCIALIAEEAFFAGDKAHIGALKALITSDTLTLEGKGKDIQTGKKNFLHVMMLSNEDWVVNAGLDSRRYVVLDVSPERMNDTDYFKALVSEVKSEAGMAAFLYDLMNMDLKDFNPRVIPETAALKDQRNRSLDSDLRWFKDILDRGYVTQDPETEEGYQWHEVVTTDELLRSYKKYSATERYKKLTDNTSMGTFLQKFKLPPRRQSRTSWDGEKYENGIHRPRRDCNRGYRPEDGSKSVSIYSVKLGPLDALRQKFTEATGLEFEKFEIDDDDEGK